MKIDITQNNILRLKEVFSGILLKIEEGNQIGICMRDDTIEIDIMIEGKSTDNRWRINMQTGQIESMKAQFQYNQKIFEDDEGFLRNFSGKIIC